ncbi:UNVERIFIED_CONTAM: FT-interacting protein 3 [Sesamum radiatum]|uniref:FT-interacting protein 3 n=1 Tax=Sesamum radiatum TaxID=300843 RepID=A0AAW2NR06_SESRA
MLAVWMGTQADEAFPEAWHSDAAAVSGADGLANIRSKVYLSPKLWYLRVNVIEAQDLQPSDKSRFPEVFVKAILGNQALRTRVSMSKSINPMWNEDLMFVAAEPFEEPLILSVEDRVAPNKDEVLGRCAVPLQYVDRRLDHKPVSRWYNLEKHVIVEGEKKKEVSLPARFI